MHNSDRHNGMQTRSQIDTHIHALAKENGQIRCRIYPRNSYDEAARDTNAL